MILVWLLLIPISFFLQALFVDWGFWALDNTGVLENAVTYSDACTITAPLWCYLFLIGCFKGVREFFS